LIKDGKPGFTIVNGHLSPRKFVPKTKIAELTRKNFVAKYNAD